MSDIADEPFVVSDNTPPRHRRTALVGSMGSGTATDISELIERLKRKRQTMPVTGGGFIKMSGGYPHKPVEITSGSYVTDNGVRLVNPDGPEAATALEALQSENERLRESESNLVKQINGYKDVLAQAEGIIYELREEKQIDQSPRTRWG